MVIASKRSAPERLIAEAIESSVTVDEGGRITATGTGTGVAGVTA